ncbi:MAG: hypothetical protein H0X14_07460 [Acidobacteria bacterium]|nr:hypothetical protein [Acidobacteriota bacterium]
MTDDRPIVKQLDHIVVRVNDARSLHALLSETFQLPVSWPIQVFPSFTSGGITLGNVNLEILSCGFDVSTQDGESHVRAIVFESVSLAETVAELARRAIPHTPVLDYELKQAGGERIAHWANVILGKLLGDDAWLKFFVLSTRLPGYMWWANRLKGSLIERQGMDKLFGGALVFLVEYYYQHFIHDPGWSEYESHEEKRAADLAALRARGGGALGVEDMQEVVASVRDFALANELWRRFLAPVEPVAPGLWRIADGPAVRIVPGEVNAIQTLVWKVSSRARAAKFLSERGMLGSVSENQLMIDRAKIYGLDVRLVE